MFERSNFPPQLFLPNSPCEWPDSQGYESVVSDYMRSWREIVDFCGEDFFVRWLSDEKTVIVNICCSLPAKTEGLLRLINQNGWQRTAPVVNVDFGSDVLSQKSWFDGEGIILYSASVKDFMVSLAKGVIVTEASNIVLVGLTVAGEAARDALDGMVEDRRIQALLVSTLQPTERAEPEFWDSYADYQVIEEWRQRNSKRLNGWTITNRYERDQSGYTEKNLYFFKRSQS